MRKKVVKVRSKLEASVIKNLQDNGVEFKYEEYKIKYQKKLSTYTPDLLLRNGIFIEIKGYFDAEDRAKHLLIQAQHPDLEIRFVFQAANKKIHKSSRTTYAEWCVKHGFTYAEGYIPPSWLGERGSEAGRKIYQDRQSARRKAARADPS